MFIGPCCQPRICISCVAQAPSHRCSTGVLWCIDRTGNPIQRAVPLKWIVMHPLKNHRIVRQGPTVARLDGQRNAVVVADPLGQNTRAPPGLQPAASRTGVLQGSTPLPAPLAP